MKPVFSSRDFSKKSRIPKTFSKKMSQNNRKKSSSKINPLFIFLKKKKESFFGLFRKKGNKKPQKSKSSFWKKVGKIFGILCILGIIFIIGIFLYFSKDLPSPDKVNSRFITESTKIYDRTGEVLLYDIHGEEKRTLIPFEEMPDSIKYATIALEDRDFYNHYGIQFSAIARAFISQVFGIGTRSGGSTITQQLVKNSLLTSERSITRKVKEAILAIELELKFSKDEILAMYLNEIPYGSNAYGIEAAARTFFAKNARDLTVDEAAILASLPQAPSRYSPRGSNRELLKGRQEVAITQMAELGYISKQERDQYINTDVFAKVSKFKEDIKAPHFVFYIIEQLEELYGTDFLQENGLSIITTLDWEKQQIAQRIVREKAFENEEKYNAENAALIAIDPQTGEILTMVGSRNYFDEEIDGNVNVAIRDRQPGSSFKPYVYLQAFVNGYTPETILFDAPTEFPHLDRDGEYTPQNYDGTFRGPVKIKEALGLSLNIPAVKALYLVGVPNAINFAKTLGITGLNNDTSFYGLSLVLGGGEVKLVDHVAAFSVFAAEGVKNDKYSIKEIQDKDGVIVKNDFNGSPRTVINKDYIAMLSHSLSTNEYRIPAFGADNPLRFDDRPVAAKTGTTNENRDAWTLGYTPEVAIGVWGGNNDNSSMNSGGVGANVAAPIFREFLLEAYPNSDGQSFPKYDKDEFETGKEVLDGELDEDEDEDVCLISSSKQTYCYENKYCPKEREKERTVIQSHNILHYVIKDDPRGDEPDKPKSDPYYSYWEDGLEDFYQSDDKTIFGGDIDDCERDDFDDYEVEIEIDKLSQDDDELKIDVDVDSPFGDDQITYIIDGKQEKVSESESYTYKLSSGDIGDKIDVEVRVKDGLDEIDSDKKSITISPF